MNNHQPTAKVVSFDNERQRRRGSDTAELWPERARPDYPHAARLRDATVGQLVVTDLETAKVAAASIAAFHICCYLPEHRERALQEFLQHIHEQIYLAFPGPGAA